MNDYESGYWAVSEDVAKSLKGKHIYLHKAQAKASFFGGPILDYRMTDVYEGGSGKPRAVFTFTPTLDQKNVKAKSLSWGIRAEKYIDDDGAHFIHKKGIGLLGPID